MNRKLFVAAGGFMTFVIMAGTMFCLSRNLSVQYECKVDFLFEYERPEGLFGDDLDRKSPGCYVDKRRAGREDISHGFKKDLDLFSSRNGVLKCQRDIETFGVSTSRTMTVLASARLDVVGMPCTNLVYPCRLVIADADRRNLGEYARFCMDSIRERLDEENWILVARVAMHEYQQMRKAERRIAELEEQVLDGGGTASNDAELEKARQVVREMQKRIEEIRSDVMSRREQRIIYESQPEISWAIRRKMPK